MSYKLKYVAYQTDPKCGYVRSVLFYQLITGVYVSVLCLISVFSASVL